MGAVAPQQPVATVSLQSLELPLPQPCARAWPTLTPFTHQEAMFHAGPEGPEWWVTVFGFPPSLPEPELKAILRDFQARITPLASHVTRAARADAVHRSAVAK
jgi:hypothetical protein